MSSQKTPLQNLETLAQGAIPMTEEHYKQLTHTKEQHFPTKAGTCIFAAVTLVFLGIVAARTLNKNVGVMALGLAVVPLGVLYHFRRLESSMKANLAIYEQASTVILNLIGQFLLEKEHEKAEILIKTCGEASSEQAMSQKVKESVQSWNDGINLPSSMTEHPKYRQLARSLLARKDDDQELSLNSLKARCHGFLFGSGNANIQSYMEGYPIYLLTTGLPYVRIVGIMGKPYTVGCIWVAAKW